MTRILSIIALTALALWTRPALAGPAQHIETLHGRVHLLELYTSQGCSSCPPADAWLSKLVDDERLWTEVVPVAFHVDYWNYLGWDDPFSTTAFSQRQRDVAATWKDGRVYTPGFVLDGEEWRGFYGRRPLPLEGGKRAGKVRVDIENGRAAVAYESADDDDVTAHLAVLGFGLKTYVGNGENKGRELTHDFVVLGYETAGAERKDGALRATLPLEVMGDHDASRYAVAVWFTAGTGPAPLQAAGGWLSDTVLASMDVTTQKGMAMSEKVEKTEKEWREILTDEQFRVAREKGTERAFTGEYWDNHQDGVYLCVACGLPLFSSDTKYESGSGWPSFYQPVEKEHILEESDRSLGMVRTEVMCNRCESHLGHVFPDGPRPTGLRYCINSASLKFVPRDEKK